VWANAGPLANSASPPARVAIPIDPDLVMTNLPQNEKHNVRLENTCSHYAEIMPTLRDA